MCNLHILRENLLKFLNKYFYIDVKIGGIIFEVLLKDMLFK